MDLNTRFSNIRSIHFFRIQLAYFAIQTSMSPSEISFLRLRKTWTSFASEVQNKHLISFFPEISFRVGGRVYLEKFIAFFSNWVSGTPNHPEACSIDSPDEVRWEYLKTQRLSCRQAKYCFRSKACSIIGNHIIFCGFEKLVVDITRNKPLHCSPYMISSYCVKFFCG